jgi:hypothetical protein
MFDVQLKSAMEEKLQGMLDRIAGLEDAIAQELTDWQVQDMNRKYPHTDQSTGTASTMIYPRSRLNTPRRRAIIRGRHFETDSDGNLRPIGATVHRPVIRKKKTRPILRAVLIELLQARMKALGERTLSWQ